MIAVEVTIVAALVALVGLIVSNVDASQISDVPPYRARFISFVRGCEESCAETRLSLSRREHQGLAFCKIKSEVGKQPH